MRVFKRKQLTSLAAILLMMASFALWPPDAFCRTQFGHRTRSSRTVRPDDHDHDSSHELRTHHHHSSPDHGLDLAEAVADHKVRLHYARAVELQPLPSYVSATRVLRPGRAPPVSC